MELCEWKMRTKYLSCISNDNILSEIGNMKRKIRKNRKKSYGIFINGLKDRKFHF